MTAAEAQAIAALEGWTWGRLAQTMELGRRARALRLRSAHLAGITDDSEVMEVESERVARLDSILAGLRREYADLASPDPLRHLRAWRRFQAGRRHAA